MIQSASETLRAEIHGPTQPPDNDTRLCENDGKLKENCTPLYYEEHHVNGKGGPPKSRMLYPRDVDLARKVDRRTSLQHCPGSKNERKRDEADPVAKRASREVLNAVSLGLAREFVPVPGDNEEVLYIFSNDLAVVPPEWGHGI